MTLYPYEKDIPFATDNPSDDQPDMQINANSIFDLINEDHIGFKLNNGGFHQQLRMPVRSAPPINTIVNSANLYSKLADAVSPQQHGNFWCSTDNNSTEFQMTRIIPEKIGDFGPHSPGWTWLPGGLLLQYGFVLTPGISGTVNFSVPFTTTVLSLTFGFVRPAGTAAHSFWASAVSTTQFTYESDISSGASILYWMAIGI